MAAAIGAAVGAVAGGVINTASQVANNLSNERDAFACFDVNQLFRSAIAGTVAGIGFASGIALSNPALIGAITNVSGNLTMSIINDTPLDAQSILIDAVVGAVFGSAFSRVLGGNGLLRGVRTTGRNIATGQVGMNFATRIPSSFVRQQTRWLARASAGGAINATQGATSRLLDGNSLEESLNATAVLGDYFVGTTVTLGLDVAARVRSGPVDHRAIGNFGPAESHANMVAHQIDRVGSSPIGIISNTNLSGSFFLEFLFGED